MARRAPRSLIASALAVAFVAAGLLSASAQTTAPTRDPATAVQVGTAWSAPRVAPGGQVTLWVILDIQQPLHVNTDRGQIPAALDSLIATAVTVTKAPKGVAVGAAQYPAGRDVAVNYPGLPGKLKAYEGQVAIQVPITVGRSVRPGSYELGLEVQYQACDAQSCYQPQTLRLALSLEVGGAPASPGASPVRFDFLGQSFEVTGTPVVLLIAFVVGVLLNFTPCVLPVVPIKVLSLQRQAGNAQRRLVLGLWFSAGIVACFLALGALGAGLVGVLGQLQWGEQFSHWWFTGLLGAVILTMALGMFGLFATGLPQWVYGISPKHETLAGSFLFGVLTAVLSTPCTAPMMAGTLTWATRQSAAVSLGTFGVMGLGMAVPYMLLLLNPRWLERLPRTGPGSELVKQVMGGLLVAVAIYFFGVAGKPWWGASYWWVVLAVLLGTMGWMAYRTFVISRRTTVRAAMAALAGLGALAGVWAVGTLAMPIASAPAIASAGTQPGAGAAAGPTHDLWRPWTAQAADQARRDGKIVVVEFTADWCLNCKALELSVLRTSAVVQRLSAPDVAAFRVDLTSKTNRQGWAQVHALGTTGIPLTAVYRPGQGQPTLLTSIYTTEALLAAIDGPSGAR